METRRFFNPSQPQTLQISVWLLYATAVLGLLFGNAYFSLGLLIGFACLVACAAAAFGIANEQRWGYGLGVGVAALEVVLLVLSGMPIIPLMFAVALLVALLHPMSRDYQRIWFS